MKNIIIILGEPNSISSEIFIKSLNYLKKIKLNFIIIGNYSLLKKQANYLGLNININFHLSKISNLKKTKFNFINVDYKQLKPFDLKLNKSEEFIKKCFFSAITLIKNKLKFRLLIIGEGKNKEKIVKYIDKHNLNNNVKVLDYKKNPFKIGRVHV